MKLVILTGWKILWKKRISLIKVHENDDVNKILLLLLFVSDMGKTWGGKNIYDRIDTEIKGKYNVKKMNELIEQQMKKYKIDRSRLIKGSKESMYLSEVIVIPIIMQSTLSNPKTIKFRSDLGFNQINLILKKEQSVVILLLKTFSAEKIKLQHKILENERVRIYMYFSEQKLVVEIDEKGHIDRNQNKENERQTKIEKHPDCKFFHRINPDVEGFDIFLEISKIQNYITKSNEEKLERKFAKELLSYMSNIYKTLKHIRYFVAKILPTL